MRKVLGWFLFVLGLVILVGLPFGIENVMEGIGMGLGFGCSALLGWHILVWGE